MRGKGVQEVYLKKRHRITPAYAGKSFFAYFWGTDAWDHPRLCGEKPVVAAVQNCVSGSPPPMRGKVLFQIKL